MSRIIKVPSRQANQPTIAQPLVDFDVPGGQYDLSKSYFVLNTSVPSTNANNICMLKLQSVDAGNNADAELRDSSVFVKHSKLRSSTSGQIENNRHINVLRLNQKIYEESISKDLSQNSQVGLDTPNDINNLAYSPFRNTNKLGTIASSDKSHNYIIRMKDVLPFCKTDYYDTDDKGDLSVGLELNLGKSDGTSAYTVVQSMGAGDNYLDRTYLAGDANGTFADQVAGNVNPINTKKVFKDLSESPYYVGQRLVHTGTNLTGTGATQRQITAISRNANNTLAITFDAPLIFTGNSTNVVASFVDEVNLANKTPTFNFMELVLVQVPKQSPRDYQYTTYKLQEDTVATQSLNKTYLIGGMTKNVYVITPDDNEQLLSNTVVNSYRFSVDNNATTNRDIQFGASFDSLHQIQILKTYDNKDEPLKRLTGKLLGLGNSKTDDGGVAFGKSYMVMTPVPITDKQKVFGLELNTGANLGRVMIYEEEVKQL